MFELQNENDKLKEEVKKAKEREEEMKTKMEEAKSKVDSADKRVEELAAYVRRNNMRIFGVEEKIEGEKSKESTEECEQKVLKLLNEKLKLNVQSGDIGA